MHQLEVWREILKVPYLKTSVRGAVASGLSTRIEEPVEFFFHVPIIQHVITRKTNNVQSISAETAIRELAQIPHTILTAVDAV